MNSIYLDNASTTFPKPECVVRAIAEYMTANGCNISRSSYSPSYEAGEMVYDTRALLAEYFDAPDPACVCFTKNVTESLNLLLKGFLKPGDHVIVSSFEHNAVMRPLQQLCALGVTFSVLPGFPDGTSDLQSLPGLLRPETRLVVCNHAGNVSGTIQPLKEMGEFCTLHGLAFFVDTAQTAGHLPISMSENHISALAFTGHKGLYGPQGIGGFLLSPGYAGRIEPLLSGGTGSLSHSEEIPSFLPDRFEAGTQNLPGIAGLRAALLWQKKEGLQTLRNHELALTQQFICGLREELPPERYRILGISDPSRIRERVGVVSLAFPGRELSELALALETDYGILTRVGLHCAPRAHRALGSFPEGAVRFSFGYFNTPEEVQTAVTALKALL